MITRTCVYVCSKSKPRWRLFSFTLLCDVHLYLMLLCARPAVAWMTSRLAVEGGSKDNVHDNAAGINATSASIPAHDRHKLGTRTAQV